MKTHLLIIIALFAVAMCSCTEEILIEKIVKELVYLPDTTTYKSATTIRKFHHVDTTGCKVKKPKCPACDPEIIIEVDSVFITQTIIEYDTIDHYIHVYHDTLIYPVALKGVTYIPEELIPFVSEFYYQSGQRGWTNMPGGNMVIQYSHDMPGPGWNSTSYWLGGGNGSSYSYEQMVIEVNGDLPAEQQYASILRELARLQIRKKYASEGDKIMNIFFPPSKLTIDSPEKGFYLDELFADPI